MAERLYPKVVVRRNVRNQSARSGSIRAIIVHDTESDNRAGASDLAAIGTWFDNPKAQASSAVCTDGDGTSARYVADDRKAWHAAAYNSATLGIEQIGHATQGVWSKAEVDETARWLAYWSIKHGIPLRRGACSNGQITRTGVLRHMDLGSAGGGHHDPGVGFPLDACIVRARHFRAAMIRRGRA